MPKQAITPVNRRALKVLFDTYWTSAGWRNERSRSTPPEDFEFAKQAGVMFDPISTSHTELEVQLSELVRHVEREAVADAFVASLSERRLDRRSALGSFAVFQHFKKHANPLGREQCAICGCFGGRSKKEDLNVLNFERFKWGGVRHDQSLYAALDLRLFQGQARSTPTSAQVRVLEKLLSAIGEVPADTSSAELQKYLAKIFKSSKAERENVVSIFGYCGILGTEAHPGYMSRFVPWSDRETPNRRFVDLAYPACWWRRSDGINQTAVDFWFGHLL
ncbi:MAG: hypothetical protein U0744_11950 [Gemmataceae bacterium]